jgi:chromosome partitioning protein
MSVPVLTFFNNKGGVGKTSLVYHLAWMFAEQGRRVLAVDLDPQANLTSAFLDDEALERIWIDDTRTPSTIHRCVEPLMGVGDLRSPVLANITTELALLPGALELSRFEDELSRVWPDSMGDQNLGRPFRILTAFWQICQDGARQHRAEIVLVDVGPNLGAINRSVLIGTDHVVIPLGPDLFSLQGLRNLGPALKSWRNLWRKRLENWQTPEFPLPKGNMRPAGYIAQQHNVRLSRPVQAYNRWLSRIPQEYRQSVLDEAEGNAPSVDNDPLCLALLKHYRSLMPLAQEARKPLFLLRPSDGAMGAHTYAVRDAYQDFKKLSEDVARAISI